MESILFELKQFTDSAADRYRIMDNYREIVMTAKEDGKNVCATRWNDAYNMAIIGQRRSATYSRLARLIRFGVINND